MNNMVMMVECLVRSEFTVPGWTEFTVTLVPARQNQLSLFFLGIRADIALPAVPLFVGEDYLCQCTFEPAGQLPGKQHISQFTLAVSESAVVAALAVKVMEANPAEVVRQRRDDDNASWSAALQQCNQEVRQQEVTQQK